MKFAKRKLAVGAALVLSVAGLWASSTTPALAQPAAAGDLIYYELRTYTAAPGALNAVLEEFKGWIIPGLERAGMKPVAYWVKEGGDGAVVYLLAFHNRAERDAAWKAFQADPETAKLRAETTARTGVARSMTGLEDVFMTMADFSPHPRMANGTELK
jgi:hypothetical protein